MKASPTKCFALIFLKKKRKKKRKFQPQNAKGFSLRLQYFLWMDRALTERLYKLPSTNSGERLWSVLQRISTLNFK